MIATDLRDNGHWQFEDYAQRMPTKQWKQILLNGEDRIIFHGHTRYLVGKNLGAGVIEVRKRNEKL